MLVYILLIIGLLFFSIGVFIDNLLVNKRFKSTNALLFYSNITNLAFIPLLWFFGMPKMLPVKYIVPVTIVSIALVIYLYPYFKALKEADTSIITALFNLGKIFVPVFAYMIVNERLAMIQYVGFIIIILSSFMLTWQKPVVSEHDQEHQFLTYQGGLKVNKAFFYMMLTSIILAINSSVLKYSLEALDWITVMTWTAIISTTIIVPVGLIFFKKEIIAAKRSYFDSIWQFAANEFATFVAMACLMYAVAVLPVTIVQGILSAQPIFMIILTYIFSKYLPDYFKEDLTFKNVIKKSVFFIIMTIGIVMTVM